MIKQRLLSIILCICLIISCLSINISADNIEHWIVVYFQYSDDGTNWISTQYQFSMGAGFYMTSHRYVRISRILVLDTSNKPSDLFIQFQLTVSDYAHYNTGTTLSNYNQNWSADTSYTGYARSRFGGYQTVSYNDTDYAGSTLFVVGQYAIPDVTSTAFSLYPATNPVWSGQYENSNLMLHFSNIQIVYVGDNGELSGTFESIEEVLQDIHDNTDVLNGLVTDIWDYMCDSVYSFLRFAGWGNALTSQTTSNPFTGFLSAVSTLTQDFHYLTLNNRWGYYQTDQNGTQTLVQSNWFTSVLETLKSITSVFTAAEKYQNYADEAGAEDVISDGYDSANIDGYGDLIAIGDIADYNPNGLSHGADGALDWFSAATKNDLDTAAVKNLDDDFIDFYQDHLQEIDDWRNGE